MYLYYLTIYFFETFSFFIKSYYTCKYQNRTVLQSSTRDVYCSYIFPPTIFSRALYTGYLPCFWLKTPHAVHNALTKHKQTSLIQSFIALHTVHQQTYRFHRFITHFVLQTKKQAIYIVLIQ